MSLDYKLDELPGMPTIEVDQNSSESYALARVANRRLPNLSVDRETRMRVQQLALDMHLLRDRYAALFDAYDLAQRELADVVEIEPGNGRHMAAAE